MITTIPLRERIAGVLCPGCRSHYPLDKHGRHVHEYTQEAFGSEWQSKSWFKCTAAPVLDKIMQVISWEGL